MVLSKLELATLLVEAEKRALTRDETTAIATTLASVNVTEEDLAEELFGDRFSFEAHGDLVPLMEKMADGPFGVYYDTQAWVVEIPGAWTEVRYKCKSLDGVARTLAALVYRIKYPYADVDHLLGDHD